MIYNPCMNSTFKSKSILFELKKQMIHFCEKNITNANLNFSLSISSKLHLGYFSTNILLVNLKYIDDIESLEKSLKKFFLNIDYITEFSIAKNKFINIYIDIKHLIDKIDDIDLQLTRDERVYLEYVSANPTGPLHIGHIRGAVLGDVIANYLSYLKAVVKKEYFVNDAGNQINDLLESVLIRCKEIYTKIPQKLSANCYPGEYVIDIAHEVLKRYDYLQLSNSLIKSFVIENVLKDIFNNLSQINITYDTVVSEQSFFKNNIDHLMKQYRYSVSSVEKRFSVDNVVQELKNQDYIYYGKIPKPKEDKNWVDRSQLLFRSSNFGDDHDTAITKANQDYTYFASELCYIKYKISYDFDKYIIILGQDHIGYKNKYNAAFNIFKKPNQENIIKICANVRYIENDEIQVMSKRSGLFLSLNDVLKVLDNNIIRSSLLTNREGTIIDFDLSAKKDSHINYICNLFRKLKELNKDDFIYDEKWNFNQDEIKIILFIHSWPLLMENVYKKLEVHLIMTYLYELSILTNLILNNSVKSTKTYFLLSKAFQVIKKCFDILGFK